MSRKTFIFNSVASVPTITIISSTGAAGSGNAVTTSAISTIGATVLFANVTDYQAYAVSSVTDSLGNTWTLINNTNDGAITRSLIFKCIPTTTGAACTFSYVSSNGYPSLSVIAISSTTNTVDQINSNYTAGYVNSVNTGSITPTSNGELILIGCNFWLGNTPIITPTGFTTIFSTNYNPSVYFGTIFAYQLQTTATAVSATISYTIASGSYNSAQIISIKP